MSKTILITGATGFIGSNLTQYYLNNTDYKVIVVTRNKEKTEFLFSLYLKTGRLKTIVQDVCDEFLIDEKIDIVYHAAGSMQRTDIMEKPVSVIEPNILGFQNCVKLLIKQKEKYNNNTRIVVFSSVTVYKSLKNDGESLDETKSCFADSLENPYSVYSETKRFIEVYARAYQKQYNLNIIIVRLSTVYGYSIIAPKTAFFSFIKTIMEGKPISLKDSTFYKRDNIYIDDAIKGLVCVADKGDSGEVYNISSNGEKDNYYSVSDLAVMISKKANELKLNPFIYTPEKSISNSDSFKLDNTKLKNLGWTIETSFEDGVRITLSKSLDNKRYS